MSGLHRKIACVIWILLLAAIPVRASGDAVHIPTARELIPIGHIGGESRTAFTQGVTLYTAFGSELAIYDITDPANPVPKSSLNFSYQIWRIHVDGVLAFVALERFGFAVVDVSNRSSPAVRSLNQTVGTGPDTDVIGLTSSGNLLFAGMFDACLQIYDISNPAELQVISEACILGRPSEFLIEGSYLFAAGGGVAVVDFSTPANPQIVHEEPLTAGSEARDIDRFQDTLYIPNSAGLHIYELSDPSTPVLSKIYDLYSFSRIQVAGDRLFNVDQVLSLHDLSDPEYPARLGFLDVNWQWWDIAVRESTAYVSFYSGQVVAYDLSSPPLFYEVHTIASLEPPDTIAVCGGILYAAGQSRVSAIDFGDPSGLEILGESTNPSFMYDDLECSGKIVFAAQYTSLQIFDFTDPAEPQLLSQVELPAVVKQVEIAGDKAYVLSEGWITLNLHIIDIADPANPIVINTWPTDLYADALGITGNYLVGELASGPAIVDVSDPLNPQVLSQIPGVDWLEDLTIDDDLVYLAGAPGGLRIIDISDPYDPVSLSQTLTLGSLIGVDVEVDSAFVIGFEGDPGWLLAHLDISDPASPAIFSSYLMASDLREVLVVDGYAIVAGGGAGLFVFKEVSPAVYLPFVARH